MVQVMRRRGRRRATERQQPLGAAAERYASMGWPLCVGVHPGRDTPGMAEAGRACSCDRVGCPAPGAHPASPAWQMQATVDIAAIGEWWRACPEASIILITGRVFDVLDVPAAAGASALARMRGAGLLTGPVAVLGSERMHFYVMTRGAPADEDEWWSCGLDSSPDTFSQRGSLRWHCRDSYVLAPPSCYGAGLAASWIRPPADHPLPDALRLLEFLADACGEEARFP
ncbi:MAG: bifunctional DNA primase/polymerase [Streptosporangiaceae bacterium]|nr:bifunctional DNA primase/polymerase [Streptosporangiaceae bacterium]MBV9853460.1 bifunctional DNA primase/polymerase [Streptosporangiaceae bacterium]